MHRSQAFRRGLMMAIAIAVAVGAALVQFRVIEMGRESGSDRSQEFLDSARARQTPAVQGPLSGFSVGILVGHNRSATAEVQDVGAVCESNGQVTHTELQANQGVADIVIPRLEELGARVTRLYESDDRLNSLSVNLALSLHADSCIDATGYKAASLPASLTLEKEQVFITCLRHWYEHHTGLPWHAYSITDDMTHYHMHAKVAGNTPSVILEMGFMGGDQELLYEHPEVIADGIVDSIRCFLTPTDMPPLPEPPS
ncbi:MAG: hypothetical protein OXG36_18730 [Caldilineaceae bacterium]|nr:hypothetical protein [Caldilineaceae bacterium]